MDCLSDGVVVETKIMGKNHKPVKGYIRRNARRCKAITSKGVRCNHFASVHGYCLQHYRSLFQK